MKRTDIVNALIARGYEAEEKDSVKNGVIFEGIVIKSDDMIAPIIYTQGLIEESERRNMPLSEVVSQVIHLYEENKHIDINVEELLDRNFVLSHVRIALQRESDQDLVKKDSGYAGIEQYLYIRGDTGYTVKMNPGFLKNTGMSEEDIWEYAQSNTFTETRIRTMGEVLSDLSGGYYEEDEAPTQMYVITNQSGLLGASAALDKKSIADYFGGSGTNRLIVLPSSIHEMLLVPEKLSPGMDELNEMVRSINQSQVRPEERLTDRAYVIQI